MLSKLRFFSILIISLFISVTNAKDIKVTAYAGAQQTWKGFANFNVMTDWGASYASFNDSSQKILNHLLIDSCKMTSDFLSMGTTRYKDKYYNWHFFDFDSCNNNCTAVDVFRSHPTPIDQFDDVREMGADVKYYLNPIGYQSVSGHDPEGWAKLVIDVMEAQMADRKIKIEAVGTYNEPDYKAGKGPKNEDIPKIAIAMRKELDKRGYTDVKVFGPCHSGIGFDLHKDDGTGELDYFFNNPEAMKALDVYTFHSYHMCMRKDVRDLLYSHGIKEFWVTEGAGDAISKYFPADTMVPEDAGIFANVLADVNLGVSRYSLFEPVGSNQSQKGPYYTRKHYYLMGADTNGTVRKFIRYYYTRQFVRAMDLGAKVRLCSSDLEGGDNFKWMQMTWNKKPAVNATVAQNKNGTWGINILNPTGSGKWYERMLPDSSGPWYYAIFPDAEVNNVTVHVEELENTNSLEFKQYRTGRTTRDKYEGTVTMKNGEITIKLQPGDMVSLVSTDSTPIAILPNKRNTIQKTSAISITNRAGIKNIKFKVPPSLNGNSTIPVSINVYGMDGKHVANLINSNMTSGTHQVSIKQSLSNGMYILSLKTGNISRKIKIFWR